MVSTTPVTRADITAAADRLSPRIRTTPILTVGADQLLAAPASGPRTEPGRDQQNDSPTDQVRISLKLEYLQHSGTFKGRGAMHFMLNNNIAEAGVTAASGGNHGAAVAWAAKELGYRATIFVPTISAPTKVARLRSYGAEVVQVGAVYAESLEACEEHQAKTGATGIHAYEAHDVMAGAGTTGREFEAQVADAGLAPLDAVLVACGGGGLVGGIASWFGKDVASVACETETTTAYASAKASGEPVQVSVSGVAADALGASTIGSLAFHALEAADAQSVTVNDQAVVEARHMLWERFRIVVEPSAAVPIAVLASGAWKPDPGSHIGVVVCGANTGLADLDIATTGEEDQGR